MTVAALRVTVAAPGVIHVQWAAGGSGESEGNVVVASVGAAKVGEHSVVVSRRRLFETRRQPDDLVGQDGV